MRQIMRLESDEKSFYNVEIMRDLQEKVREDRAVIPVDSWCLAIGTAMNCCRAVSLSDVDMGNIT